MRHFSCHFLLKLSHKTQPSKGYRRQDKDKDKDKIWFVSSQIQTFLNWNDEPTYPHPNETREGVTKHF